MANGKPEKAMRGEAHPDKGWEGLSASASTSIGSLDLKQICCFVAAYEEGSFSRAAEREHCTQPGLSVTIQRLESAVAHRLFERKARGVTPTMAGKQFYASCVGVLKAVLQARQHMMDLAGSVPTQINIGLPPTLFKCVVPRMLPDFLKSHPHVDVRLAEAYSGTLTDWVLSGQTEAAIVTRPPAHLGLETTHFYRDRLVLVRRANPKSRKRGKSSALRLSDLAKLNLVIPSQRHSLRQIIESGVRLDSTPSVRILEVDGMLGTLELVRTSDWATVVANVAVMDEAKQGQLLVEPIADPELWIDFYLVRTKDALLSVACRDFLSCMRQTLNSLGGAPSSVPAIEVAAS